MQIKHMNTRFTREYPAYSMIEPLLHISIRLAYKEKRQLAGREEPKSSRNFLKRKNNIFKLEDTEKKLLRLVITITNSEIDFFKTCERKCVLTG